MVTDSCDPGQPAGKMRESPAAKELNLRIMAMEIFNLMAYFQVLSRSMRNIQTPPSPNTRTYQDSL